MNEQINEIINRIRQLESELDGELEKGRALYGMKLQGKIAKFEQSVIETQRHFRIGLIQFFKETPPLNILTAPVIYSLLLPLALIDVWGTLYQHICFRVYNIPRVVRADYVIFDRRHLAYLNLVEAINCAYCSYANGVIAYAREIGSRTEQYWCPIKHARRIRDPHERYMKFLDYGDAEGFRKKLDDYRKNDIKS
jgi:hypothetical protein